MSIGPKHHVEVVTMPENLALSSRSLATCSVGALSLFGDDILRLNLCRLLFGVVMLK